MTIKPFTGYKPLKPRPAKTFRLHQSVWYFSAMDTCPCCGVSCLTQLKAGTVSQIHSSCSGQYSYYLDGDTDSPWRPSRLFASEKEALQGVDRFEGALDGYCSTCSTVITPLQEKIACLKAEKTKFHRLYNEECFKVAPLEAEVKKLKVALRRATSELRMIMQQHECEYCNDEDQATWCGNCDPECFLKEAEKELARQNMQQLADQSDPIPDDIRKKMDEDRKEAEKELAGE